MRKFFAALLTVGILLGFGSSASAYEPVPPRPASSAVPKDSITSWHIATGGIGQQGDFSADIMNLLRTPKANSVTSWSVKPGSLQESDLSLPVQAKLNNPAGELQEMFSSLEPTMIAKIGGSFKTNKTRLGEFLIPAGRWKLDIKATFYRTTAGAAGTRPQLAVRRGATTEYFGDDYGTIMGSEISPSAGRELTGATFSLVNVETPTIVEVFAFGYNDDQSAAGSGEIAAAAQVVGTRY